MENRKERCVCVGWGNHQVVARCRDPTGQAEKQLNIYINIEMADL